MNPTALIAIITGTSTILAATLTAVWALLNERMKAKYERIRLEDERRAEATENRRRELRESCEAVQSSVLKLALTARLVLQMRRDANVRLDPEDLPDRLRQARDDYHAARVAIAQLWALCGEEGRRQAIDEVNAVCDDVFGHIISSGTRTVDPGIVEDKVQSSLRGLTLAIFPSPGGEEPASRAITPV
ncbi:hypothetical protein HD597_009613 [Nonomuraea thailandensis]|uniref:Uncharacterized protein n=1 Tax=Nonomuraea thailandensis TaxID=1188745 RepID=A0A9X2GYB9_9ACTN|nr:hypothetical protein [Nonomuraea thailandensis]MCP2362593.1 hypothetical protein [Nonomuraea thailandensis]